MSNDKQVSVSRQIDAPAEVIFDIIADPSRHHEMDGSGTVLALKGNADERLKLGSKFGMKMNQGVPYSVSSKVVEYEENRLIAWAHFGRHRWRYELEPNESGTLVTETFDWAPSPIGFLLKAVGFPKRHKVSMEKTLENLEQIALAQVS